MTSLVLNNWARIIKITVTNVNQTTVSLWFVTFTLSFPVKKCGCRELGSLGSRKANFSNFWEHISCKAIEESEIIRDQIN